MFVHTMNALTILRNKSDKFILIMKPVYEFIGKGYNNTRRADPYLAGRLESLLKPQYRKKYIDIGCGTGNYTNELSKRGYLLSGLEPSERMLSIAREKFPHITWMKGSAENIPVDDKSFHGGIATLTIHHWTDLNKAFSEIHRILIDDGRFVIFTSTPEQMRGYWLNHYFPEMMQASIDQMPSFAKIKTAATVSGLKIIHAENYFVKDDLEDYFLYAGKNRPEIYFDESIRSGISSFSALAFKKEIDEGLSKLEKDLSEKTFLSIVERYENKSGDYIFLTMEPF